MPNPLLVINFKMVKDKHNVILILVSSSKFNSLFRRFIKIVDFICSSFLPEFQVFSVISFQSFILSLQGFTWCFQLLFLSIILLLPEFFMEFFFSWWFIKDLIPSQSVHRDSFQRSSSILHLAVRSAICSTLSFEVVLCHS